MKRKLIFALNIIAVVFATNSNSQTWCPAGATWYYSDYAVGMNGYSKLMYVKDTIIKKTSCKKVTHYYKANTLFSGLIEGYTAPFFTHSEDGVAYLYNNKYGENKFDTLFNMNAQIGDKWRMPFVDPTFADSLYFMEVLDTGTRILNGFNLKWLYILTGPSPTGGYNVDTITERLGYRFDDLDYSPLSEAPHGNLRCYSDTNFGFHSTGESKSCDFVLTDVLESKLDKGDLKIYPNPANEQLTISTHLKWRTMTKLEIYDLSGKLVLSNVMHESSDQVKIPTFSLDEGIYLYKWYIDNAHVKSGKISIIHR